MGNQQTEVHAASRDGEQVSVRHTSTDSPLLPAANIRELREIDPALVDFVIEQTKQEADFRRAEHKRTNTFVFVERVSGVFAGALIAIVVFCLGAYLVINGHDWAGVVICGSALVSIISIFVAKKVTEKSMGDTVAIPPQKKQRPKRR